MAAVGLALVLLALGAVAGVRWWQDRNRTDLERALAYAPSGSARFSWTDWAAVRAELGSDVGSDSTPLEVTELLNEGYDADLTSTTAMGESADVLVERFGFSPATVSWELLSQSTTGSVLTLGVPESFDLDGLADTLASLGYQEPDSDTGVWVGGDELVATIAQGASISPQLSHIALDRDQDLVMTSDDEGYLAEAVEAVEREEGGADVADVAAAAGDAAVGGAAGLRAGLRGPGHVPGRRGRPGHRRGARWTRPGTSTRSRRSRSRPSPTGTSSP